MKTACDTLRRCRADLMIFVVAALTVGGALSSAVHTPNPYRDGGYYHFDHQGIPHWHPGRYHYHDLDEYVHRSPKYLRYVSDPVVHRRLETHVERVPTYTRTYEVPVNYRQVDHHHHHADDQTIVERKTYKAAVPASVSRGSRSQQDGGYYHFDHQGIPHWHPGKYRFYDYDEYVNRSPKYIRYMSDPVVHRRLYSHVERVPTYSKTYEVPLDNQHQHHHADERTIVEKKVYRQEITPSHYRLRSAHVDELHEHH